MPHVITREQAITNIGKTLKEGECLACHLLKVNSKYVLYEGKYSTVVFSEYPRTWGQTLILLNEHKTNVSDITEPEWSELTKFTHKAAVAIEKCLKPIRCYISSLGAAENLPNTCPHIHFNVIPVYNATDKPADIYTWEHGVLAGTEEEWKSLAGQLKKEFK